MNPLRREQVLEILRQHKADLAELYGVISLGIFGSVARDEATPESDVDVVFTSDRPDLFLTAMLKQDLEVLLDRPVDIIRLRDTMNPRLKARIEREVNYV
jgi:predicted nucleotidyltransferase